MKYSLLKKIIIASTLSMSFIITGCLKKEDAPLLPMPLIIAVAPFNQPIYDAQLLAGYIPAEQSQVSSTTMAQYNAIFKEKLAKTNRQYIFLSPTDLNIDVQLDSKGRNNVLSSWAKLAQKANADFIIVPQILDYEERQGDATNVRRPARLIVDFYLIRATHPETASLDGFLQTRSNYKEVTFLLGMTERNSVRPRQKLPAVTFAEEAMNKAIREFHL